MKALSLKQPWANWVQRGIKTIETRTWKTKYRGEILICASKAIDKKAPLAPYRDCRFDDTEPRGKAIAVVKLIECRLMTIKDEMQACCPSEDGRYAWILDDIRPIVPFAVKGMLGLFNIDIECQKCEGSGRQEYDGYCLSCNGTGIKKQALMSQGVLK